MKRPRTFEEISEEFRVSFGYIRQDMKAVTNGSAKINYTLGLLIGCACEMLAAARNERRHGYKILGEILDQQWRPLAKKLFDALRNGLAHGFDTKHIVVDGFAHQIHLQWDGRIPFEIVRFSSGARLYVRPRLVADLICKKIDTLEDLLKHDANARATWYENAHLYDREIHLNQHEVAAWKKLVR